MILGFAPSEEVGKIITRMMFNCMKLPCQCRPSDSQDRTHSNQARELESDWTIESGYQIASPELLREYEGFIKGIPVGMVAQIAREVTNEVLSGS